MNKLRRKFEGTTIAWQKTQVQIIEFLTFEGIEGVRFTNFSNSIVLEFYVRAKELGNKPVPIRMKIPFPTDDVHEVNRVYRVFYWYLTNKFEAVRSGLVEEITKEFLPYITFKTKNGVDTTIYEALKEEGNALLGDGSSMPLLE